MIDRFRRIAQRVQILRLPSIVIGLACLTAIVVVLLSSGSDEGDRILMPSFVGLLWAISLYSFIENFRSVPEQFAERQGLMFSFKHGIRRSWYWVKGLMFLASTVVALVITSRMISIWLVKDAG